MLKWDNYAKTWIMFNDKSLSIQCQHFFLLLFIVQYNCAVLYSSSSTVYHQCQEIVLVPHFKVCDNNGEQSNVSITDSMTTLYITDCIQVQMSALQRKNVLYQVWFECYSL